MSKKRKIFFLIVLFIIGQLIYFSDYIFPIQWGQIKVSGLACTCPDEAVINGQLYLRTITPDSLKKYDLDYSEIYLTEKPYTDIDPMGVDLYMVKGEIIGKDRVSETDPWNPVVQVKEWRSVDIIKDWSVKGLFFGQLIILAFVIRWIRNKNNA
ncbi:MAG: hypothetical protein L6Q66_00760 [Bacteroidia bacterium]|nr:hypothetical protein [Bacteroidia bacterium]